MVTKRSHILKPAAESWKKGLSWKVQLYYCLRIFDYRVPKVPKGFFKQMSKGTRIIASIGVREIFTCVTFVSNDESFCYLWILESQEEFAAYSQQIMKGTRLEEIPPSRYAEPPPLPPLPTMGLNAVCRFCYGLFCNIFVSSFFLQTRVQFYMIFVYYDNWYLTELMVIILCKMIQMKITFTHAYVLPWKVYIPSKLSFVLKDLQYQSPYYFLWLYLTYNA